MDLTRTPEQGRIGPVQAALFLIALVVPASVLHIPSLHTVASVAGRDAWLSAVLATAVALPFIGAHWYLALRHPGRTLFQILEIRWGPWVGRAVAALYLTGAAVHGAFLVRTFSEAVGTTILPRTPVLVIAGTAVLVSAFTARRGIEVIARINQVAAPLLLLSLLTLFALAWSDVEWEGVQPFFQTPMVHVLRGAIWPLGWFLQTAVMVQMVFPFTRPLRRAAGPLLASALVAGACITLGILLSMAVLGVFQAVHSIGMLGKLAREIAPVQFLSRTEALYILFWEGAAFVEVTAIVYRGALEAAQLFGLRAYRALAAPMGLLMVLGGSMLFPSQPDLLRFARQAVPVYSVLLGAVVPVLLLAFSLRPRPMGS